MRAHDYLSKERADVGRTDGRTEAGSKGKGVDKAGTEFHGADAESLVRELTRARSPSPSPSKEKNTQLSADTSPYGMESSARAKATGLAAASSHTGHRSRHSCRAPAPAPAPGRRRVLNLLGLTCFALCLACLAAPKPGHDDTR